MTSSSGFGEKALLTYTNCKARKQNWACRAFKEPDGGRVNSYCLPMIPCEAVCEESLSLWQIYQFQLSAMSNIYVSFLHFKIKNACYHRIRDSVNFFHEFLNITTFRVQFKTKVFVYALQTSIFYMWESKYIY